MAILSLLQSHMSIGTIAGSQLQPSSIATQKANSSAKAAAGIDKVAHSEVFERTNKSHDGTLSEQVQHRDSGKELENISAIYMKSSSKARAISTRNATNLSASDLEQVLEEERVSGSVSEKQGEPVFEQHLDRRKSVALATVVTSSSILIYALLRRRDSDLASGFAISVIYIVVSCAVISLNKYIMQDSVFPYAGALTTTHMATTWIGLFALYCLKPEMFPQMQMAPKGAEILGVGCLLPQYFIPIGCFFAVCLFGGTAAYHYCSVAFLQFMKETNVVWVFCLSALVGSQQISRARVFTIIWILVGASLAVTGEVHFVMLGFLLQALSQAGEVCKTVLGEWMMTTSNFKLDALTYTLTLAPMTLVPVAIGTAFTYTPQMMAAFLSNIPIIALSACVDVALNVTVSLVIKQCSAVTFILNGLLKDIVLVIVSTVLFGASITGQQIIGFIICLSGIAACSSIKVMPELWTWLDPSVGKVVQKR